MTDWKEKASESLRTMVDQQEALGERLRGSAGAATDSIEKLAAFQLGVVSDSVEAATTQARLMIQPGEPLAVVERQIAYATELGEGLTAKTSEFGEILGESASKMAGLFEFTPKAKGASRSRKAA